jgi:Tfp pilus assembly protein PilN
MRAVNLMPREERGARLQLGRVPLFAAAGGVVVVTAVAFLLANSASSGVEETRSEIQALEAEIAKLPTAPDSEVSVGMIAAERSNRVAALAAALQSRTAFDRVLRDISLVLPGNAWLTQLEATAAPSDAVPPDVTTPPGRPAAASGITIKGATFDHDAVATVLARLSVVPTLTDVRLTSTALVEPQAEGSASAPGQPAAPVKRGRPFVTFDIQAAVKTETTP